MNVISRTSSITNRDVKSNRSDVKSVKRIGKIGVRINPCVQGETIDYEIRKSGSDLPSGLVACSRAATYSIEEWDAARGQ